MESPADSTMHRQKRPTAAIEPLKRKSPDATARMVRDLLGLEVLRVVSSLSGLKDLQASILVFISTFCADLFQRVPRPQGRRTHPFINEQRKVVPSLPLSSIRTATGSAADLHDAGCPVWLPEQGPVKLERAYPRKSAQIDQLVDCRRRPYKAR